MALEESEKHRLISDANDARLTVEATQEVMHEMALERYNGWLNVDIVVVRNAVYQHARQVMRRGEVDQALVDLDEANLDMASTYTKIAGVNMTLYKYEMAVINFTKCLAIQIKVLGANNVDVAKTYYKIGLVYNAQRKDYMTLNNFKKCHAIHMVYRARGQEEEFQAFDPAMVRALDDFFQVTTAQALDRTQGNN